MNRSEILAKAEEYVSKDRNTQYGEPEDAFGMIAKFWSTYLATRECPTSDAVVVDAYDVACMLSLMKVARMAARPENLDSCIDLAGYAACAGEILNKDNIRRTGVIPAPQPPPPGVIVRGEGTPRSHV